MDAKDVIRQSLGASRQWLMALVADLKDAPTASAPQGHHVAWVLGHLLHAEEHVMSGMVAGRKPTPGPYDQLFGIGSQPLSDAAKYPPMDKLIAEFEAIRARTLQTLDSLPPADLEKPSHAGEDMQAFFGTIAQCFTAIALHASFHAGQVADTRRFLGRKPVLG